MSFWTYFTLFSYRLVHQTAKINCRENMFVDKIAKLNSHNNKTVYSAMARGILWTWAFDPANPRLHNCPALAAGTTGCYNHS